MNNLIFGTFFPKKADNENHHPRLAREKWEGTRLLFDDRPLKAWGMVFLEISPYWFQLQVLANREVPLFRFVNVQEIALEYKVDVNNTFKHK